MTGASPFERPRLSRATAARALGVALAVGGLALFVGLVGVARVADALWRLPASQAAGLVALGLVPVVVWGLSLRVVLAAVGIVVPVREALSLYFASVFLNGVTPFGQLGGDPPTGLLVGHVTGEPFEPGLAAIASVNALNRVGVVLLGVVGGAWLVGRTASPEDLPMVLAATIGLLVVVTVTAVVAWVNRDDLVPVVGGVLATVLAVAALVPGVRTPSRASVVGRLRRFVAAIERLGSHPASLIVALGLGIVGQVLVAGVLWVALIGGGATVPSGIVFVVVPVAKLGGLSPLPGGSLGAEVLLTGLLATVGGVPLPVATAATLLYRAAAFWIPTVLGGVVTVALLVRRGARVSPLAPVEHDEEDDEE